jgi:uncharacterized protein
MVIFDIIIHLGGSSKGFSASAFESFFRVARLASDMKKIAIIGSGIAGLACAYALRDKAQLTVFEADGRLGGHANTVDVMLDGKTYGVDTGFLVYNERTYPLLIKLFDELRVEVALSDMSFSLSRRDVDREWCGSSLASLFAQPSNLLSPRFWSMLHGIQRFNNEATQLAQRQTSHGALKGGASVLDEPLAHYLKRKNYGQAFSEDYLLPMAAAIWSCPISSMENFPVGSFVRFFHNHGLLQITNRPQWFTCTGGSRNYVQAIAMALTQAQHHVLINTPVLHVKRNTGKVNISTNQGTEDFDGVVFACHSDQALKLLASPSKNESAILSAINYQENLAYLHTDQSLMPKRRKAWAAWNYLSEQNTKGGNAARVSLTYWLNRLQPLPFETNLFVTLNPITTPHRESVLAKIAYAHPVFDARACRAQLDIPALQGLQRTWYAGAWCGYGFHEDGLKSGFDAATSIQRQLKLSSETLVPQVLAA